jgi:RHS repeat-associated protein
MRRTRYALLFLIAVLTSLSVVAQAPVCDVTCTPDQTSPLYSGATAARPKLLNARGFSSTVQAVAGPQQVPMIVGSQSYNYVIPIVNLPGRAGMDLNLNLYYNSRVWDIDTINGTATFNADRDFPSYGFRLDFGFLEYEPDNDQYILTEHDGTKRALPNNGGYNSVDGSYINYNPATGVLAYRNGLILQFSTFQSPNNIYYPSQIKDTNGNFISITYVRGHVQLIQSIRDTLGRVLTFHYDANNQLSYIDQSVAVSPVDPSGVRRYATFTWAQLYGGGYHWHNFTGLAVNGAPDFSTPLNVLTDCNYANGTGYHFMYGDWAIINKIENRSAAGTPRSYISYNYPLAAAGALTDAPTYTQQTISPDGQTTNSSVWTYGANKPATGVVTSMQVMDPTGSITVTNLDSSTGFPSSMQMKDGSGNVLRTIAYVWTTSGTGTVPSSITSTLNDTGQQSSVQYANYDNFGNPADVYENDFGGMLLRHTVTTYSTAFGGQHILNLPLQVLIKDGSGNIVGRTNFSYDDSGSIITNITDAANHDNALTVHGNLTSITRYSDAATAGGQVVRHLFYDSTGNVVKADIDCCNQKVFNFSVGYQYAYPTSIVRGPTGGTQFTTSSTWNFDYGLMLTSTDENNQVTSYQYDLMNRLTGTTTPPQGSTAVQFTTLYDDSAVSPTVTKSAVPSSVTLPKIVTTMDGFGHSLRVDTYNGSTLISSTTSSYDKLWRSSQVSNPFAPGEAPLYTTFSYDPLGRTKQVTPPTSGYTQYDYAGNSVTVTDPAGKQRKSYFDVLGRLVQVDEPGIVSDHIPANNYLTLQAGGNVVLFDPYNNPLWFAGTSGTGYSPLELQDDGNLVLYQFKWQTGTYRTWNGAKWPYDSCYVGGVLFAGQQLTEGQCLENTSNSTFAVLTNGDLQMYDRLLGQITWHSNTYGNPGAHLIMQSDGNLVIYSAGGVALWSSGTYGSGANVAELEEDGRLILYSTVWNAGTSQGQVSGSLTHPSCDMGWGLGSTGTMATGQCLVSRNGHFQLMLQSDGNLVLSKIDVTPPQTLWSTNTALTPLSLEVAFHTTYTYDPLGNRTGVSQAAITGQSGSGQTRSYVYDGLSRLISSTTPEAGTVTNFYTPLPGFTCNATDPTLVCRIQDARGVVKNLSYDGINRLIGIQYTNINGGPDPGNAPPVTYQYDFGGAGAFALNRLTSITEGPPTPTPVNSHTFTYDNLGRILTDTQSIDQKTYKITYAYNLASQLASITYPSGRVVVQTYDAVGRLCSIGASGSSCTSGTRYATSLTYNAAGETLGLTMGNGVQGAFTYNDHLQLATLRYFKGATSPDILNLTYDYTSAAQPNNNGQIQAMHYFTQPGTEDQTKSESFTYDQLGRLKAAQTLTVGGAGTWSLQWTYDRFDNRLSQGLVGGSVTIGQPQFTVDPATNRITGYCYDLAGNLLDQAACPAGSHQYSYDGANRLTSINAGAAYSYLGPQRIKKVVGSTTTRYIYSGGKPIAEYVGTTKPTLSAEYIYIGSRLLVTIAGNNTTYHHPDHLSNRSETNSSGTPTRTFGQFPFGETWYETGTADKWKFSGYERDSGSGETGLDYANFRYYGSGLGQFISPDPLGGHPGSPLSLNRYAYALNDPINLSDPLGLSFACTYSTITDTDGKNGQQVPGVCQFIDDGCVGFFFSCTGGNPADLMFLLPQPQLPNLFPGPGLAPQPGPLVKRLLQVQWIIDLILNGINDCSDFFNNNAMVGPYGSAAVYDNLSIQIQDNSTATGTYTSQAARSEEGSAYQSPNTVLIWTNSPAGVPMQPANFGGQSGPPALLHIGSFLGGTLGADVVIMMHELAHVVDAIPRDGPSVDPTGKLSQQNTDTILKNCEDAIKDALSQLEP